MIDEQQLNQLNIKRAPVRRMNTTSKWIIFCVLAVAAAFGVVVGWRTWYFYKLVKSGSQVRLAHTGNFTVSPRARGFASSSFEAAWIDRAAAPAFGSQENTSITIVQFADFECPFSRDTYGTIRELMTTHEKDVRFVFRHFPIAEVHPHALKASEAASCANDQGKFWAYYDKLFQNQSQLENADLKRYAKEAGLASSAFNACLDGGVHYKEVMQDYQDGVRAGVRGTPTFFVNGQKVEGVITLPEWEKLITYFKK
ncbi:MAG: DSBA oxidoreductase [Candidatus Magasanikbacteria bacterium GW2011_GWA2_45_39]|uniref:DSBA oxidoreductase n=2 Tax=Candidatus Magasanikiibacteriota TaxID=1752731 RepID=A0A0G1Q6Q2_9BACT|nr:MAG: DSBA oxidoreductase [Candidatus Magasanikbacteria bacterium GW2011_GWA2_45_39]KKU13428.1 MAG: DSBA oxidoreductase [Candidatus Magasanikbacteria bacterium GW2011_GWC2_45_8]